MTVLRVAHVAIVLDRSGSMESCRRATISGFNRYIAGVKETAEREELLTQVTLTVFNEEVSVRYLDAPLPKLRPLSLRTYRPNGSTAMLDAVGETIERLRGVDVAGVDTCLVCVISDGYENASCRYSYADVAERIQSLTATDRWSFTYLGSNQDLSQISQAMSIPLGNMAAYAATPEGTDSAWGMQLAGTEQMLHQAASGDLSRSDDFYSERKRT